ncbi:uncharacterized protein JN550_005839 [Neoarthrinium moseri]|uniref:uncharacterized protein n=1 Tax=Neoarthrinium moseri TaxID=1658444 RepID=UPI001FDD8475|nr:uncharacterized protein JN550_005839 [Neoarthrinium moseri]KAI1869209.1 hypothetical protein JN550_005839 [Neoarthrinium moseri]
MVSQSSLPTSPNDARSSLAKSPTDRPPNARATATGYMGYTSYSTVIEETLSILSSERQDNTPCGSMGKDPIRISPKTLQLAVTILHHVPYTDEGVAIYRKDMNHYHAIIKMIAERVLHSLYEAFGQYLGRDRSAAKYEALARKICYNSSQPVLNLTDTDAWLDQFCGPNLRWESLGLLFNYWDLEKSAMVPTDPLLRKSYCIPTMQECLMLCVELSQEFSGGNLFLVFLKYRRAVLESMLTGDAGRQTWRYHADTISSLTFLGMHAEATDSDSYKPTLYSELSRRIFAMGFIIDKVTVAFTGRPPLISQMFVTTPMPLDLKDDYFFLDHESRLEKMRTTLDEKGWNTEGGFYSSTYIRARLMLAKITEQIAVIALGTGSHTTRDDLQSLKEKHAATVSEFPPVLLWHQDHLTDYNIETNDLFTRLLLRLEIILNNFFLERLFLRMGQTDGGALLAASFELVSLVLNLWTHMDRFEAMRQDFEWLLVGYGAPGGGILCKCLLKSRSGMLDPSQPHITRSAVIQKLSIFAGFLNWVRPTAPNAELCGEIGSVVQQVLDQALNTVPNDTTILEGMDWDFGGQVDFSFDLMDTFDWLRTDFSS